MKTFKAMLKTELKLSLRGMDMFQFAICMPLIVLLILGIIYADKPVFDGIYVFGAFLRSTGRYIHLCRRCDGIASLLYFPMLIFSGATLPYEVIK